MKPPKITERPPRFGNIDDWTKAQNANISEQFHNALNSFGKTVMDAAKKPGLILNYSNNISVKNR